MSISISGQNEPWAQIAAYQPPPTSQPGQNGGWNSTSGTTASSGSTGNAASAAGTTAALSDDMSFALMAFGGWGTGSAPSSQVAGQGNGTSNTSSFNTTTAAPDGTSPESQLLTDMQSLLSALTGSAGSSTSSASPTSSAAGASGAASGGTGTDATSGLSGTLLQDLQAVASDLNTIASVSGTSQPGGPPPAGAPWSNDISNTGTNAGTGTGAGGGTGGTGGWNPGYTDGFRQQFALSAYAASNTMGADSSVTAAIASVTA